MKKKTKSRDAYAAAGVNIDAGNEAVRRMRQHVRSARTRGMITDIGSFGGLFQLPGGLRQPLLVASTDGVGTKLMVAVAARRFDTVGQDLVNHCVNDILVQGAEPLFFLDYFATAQLKPRVAEQVVKGLAKACRENGCALLGGETAEMPGLYHGEDFDLAGTVVGVVEKRNLIDGRRIKPGDVILGLPSTGLHTNGYSLARKIFFEKMKCSVKTYLPELRSTVGKALLAIHRSYLPIMQSLWKRFQIKGLAHITGGGLIENIPRILPDNCQAVIQSGTWPVPPLFELLAKQGRLNLETAHRTLNMGIGWVIVASPAEAAKILRALAKRREPVYVIGDIQKGRKKVRLDSH